MERKLNIGEVVVYIDEVGVKHNALVVAVWPKEHQPATVGDQPQRLDGCNLVFVSDDKAKQDTYGQQIERDNSVIHKSNQPAKRKCWCFLDE